MFGVLGTPNIVVARATVFWIFEQLIVSYQLATFRSAEYIGGEEDADQQNSMSGDGKADITYQAGPNTKYGGPHVRQAGHNLKTDDFRQVTKGIYFGIHD